MELIDNAFSATEAVHAYFGYTEDWRAFPLDDARKYYWHVEEPDGSVTFFEEPLTGENVDNGQIYLDEIYTYRHLSKWVWRTEAFTMILCDTNTDGNIFLRIFDNLKEMVPVGDSYRLKVPS